MSDHEAPFDPASRRLCPDGACVGVIGSDGRCGVCGRADDGRPDNGGTQTAESAAEEAPATGRATADEVPSDGGFDPERRLCPDGSCVGVLGQDGRCRECGRAA